MYRVFKRVSWKRNPSCPNGIEPQGKPPEKCRTVDTVASIQEARDLCAEYNDNRPKKSPARELAGMREFTEI